MAKRNVTASGSVSFNAMSEELQRIRHALLIGLASYGELERLQNAQELAEMLHAEASAEMKDQLRVLHPTGQAETVGEFAAALRDVEHLASALSQ